MPRANKYLEAFKENYNTVGIATAAALSLATLNPFPLLAGVVAETVYLLFVPDSKWYAARLAKRFDADVVARRQQLRDEVFPTIRPELQVRFQRLEEMRRQIDAQSQDDKQWFREVLRKLDYLLEKFLQFASKEAEFRNYLSALRAEIRGEKVNANFGKYDLSGRNPGAKNASRNNPRHPILPEEFERKEKPLSADSNDKWVQNVVDEVQSHYERERENVQKMLEDGQDNDTRAVLEKRADVLARREEFAGKMAKILINVNHQLQLVEDTFGLINDEIRARSPEQILADIEEVVVATEVMSSALEELSAYK